MTSKVLFICLGNICRSPLAAAVFRKQVAELDLDVEADSAGVGGWHIGQAADARAIVAGRMHGIDLETHTARRLKLEDFDLFDLLLVADKEVYDMTADLAPEGTKDKIAFLSTFGKSGLQEDIPDPYYTGHFDPVIATLEDYVAGLLRHLKAEQDRRAAST